MCLRLQSLLYLCDVVYLWYRCAWGKLATCLIDATIVGFDTMGSALFQAVLVRLEQDCIGSMSYLRTQVGTDVANDRVTSV